jgi:hypothetical protein
LLRRLPKGRQRAAQKNKAGGAPKGFGSPPASTEPGYHACICGVAWDGLGDLATFPVAAPPKGPSTPFTLRNYAGPQHFCHYRGYDSAWVPGTVLGCPDPGDRPFSSGPILAVPGFRRSFVLRDSGHIKSQLSLKS